MRNVRQSATAASIRCGRSRTDAILAAVGARATGGAAAASYYFAKPLSPAQFVGKLRHICVSARGRLEQILSRKPTSLPDASNIIGTLTSNLDAYMQELRGLTPPPSVAAPFRYVLGNLRSEQLAMHNLDELASTGQWARAERLVESPGWRAMANRFGPPVKPADIDCS
jgi:hypothetical protein